MFKKLLSLFLTLTVLLSTVATFASCFTGGLEFRSFTVDGSTVKTQYEVGDEIDFSAIKVIIRYSDETQNKTLTYSDLTVEYPANFTSAAGTYTVVVKYEDPLFDNAIREHSFGVIVADEGSAPLEGAIVSGFSAPQAYIEYLNSKNSAGSAAYGDANFEGQFFSDSNAIYYVGDDNPFIFLPELTILVNNIPTMLTQYAMDITLSVKGTGNAFTALTRTAGASAGEVKFYNGDTLIATVNKLQGKYQFTSDAIGSVFKISVLPNAEEYDVQSVAAQTITFEVIDAYNVYTAKDLIVIDNSGDAQHLWGNADGLDAPVDPTWVNMQTAAGISGAGVNGVVFHKDVILTHEDVPQEFFHQNALQGSYYITGTDGSGNDITEAVSEDTYFLYDQTSIFIRNIAENQTFRMEGNYFQLNVELFPLVASPTIVGEANEALHYRSDFSNARLFDFEGASTTTSKLVINNLDYRGNANRSEKKDSGGNLVSAGGLIFAYTKYSDITMTNTIMKTSFISLFPKDGSVMNVENVKIYDSFNNAGFLMGNAILNIEDSYIQRAGGPLFIVQHWDPNNNPGYHPVLAITDSVCESYVAGSELWFKSFGADGMAAQLKLMTGLTEGYLNTSYVNDDDKMNVVAMVMANSSNPMEVVGNFNTEGYITVTNTSTGIITTLDKTHSGVVDITSDQGAYANYVGQQVAQQTGGTPTAIFNVEGIDDTLVVGADAGGNYFLTFDASTMADATTDLARLGAAQAEYAQHDYMTMNYGGMGFIFGATHAAK